MKEFPIHSEQSIQRELLFVMAIIALWICSRPYYGIWHDAILYTGQALHLLYPENFSSDLFFLYGSQDNYTLFTEFYALIISWLGIDNAALALSILGQGIWLTGVFYLTRKLLPYPVSWLAMGFIIGLLGYYSDYSIFMVGEAFTTPRPYAEGLSMIALACLLSKRYVLTGVLLIFAAVLHPLNALPALTFVFFWISQYKPRTAAVIASTSIIAIVAIALKGIPPANSLLLSIDHTWFDITNARSPHLYTSSWDTTYWNGLVVLVSLLGSMAFQTTGQLSAACRATFLTVTSGLLIAWVSSESLASLLLIQLQTWRSVWLAQIITVSAASWFIWQTLRGKGSPTLVLGFLASWLYIESIGGIIAVGVLIYSLLPERLITSLQKLPLIIIGGLVVLGGLEYIALQYVYYTITLPVLLSNLTLELTRPLLQTLLIGCLLFIVMWPASQRARMVTGTIIAGVLIVTVMLWDKRSETSYWPEQDTDAQAVHLKELIKDGETVYWMGSSSAPAWFFLRRSSYYSGTQAAGAIFHRNTATEAYRRHILLSVLYQSTEGSDSIMHHGAPKELPELMEKDIQHVCTDPALDWLLLPEALPGSEMKFKWKDDRNWYLYQCSKFRHNQI